MDSFKFDPEKLSQELLQLNQQLVDGLSQLQQLPPVEVGQTPHQLLYREDKLELKFYPAEQPTEQPPLLIVYALVNRPYILDLQPDRSLIRALNQRGLNIYLIDWGYPDAADAYLDLDDYINGYIDNCVSQVCHHSGFDKINLLGVCQGGAFSLCYSALNPDRVNSLITLVTPVDFQTPDNLLSHLARQLDIDLARQATGNIAGELLPHAFNALMPMRLNVQKYLNMPRQLGSEAAALNFLRMEQWINDSPDLAGQACREFVDKFFHRNQFINGGLEIGDRPVELKNYCGPLLNIFAKGDHLVPPSASKALAGLTASQDYREEELSGGHIGVFVGRHAQQQLPDLVIDWLAQYR